LKATAQEETEAAKGRVSDIQQKWSDHVADVRRRVADRKA
jgi:hypothetical protein